MCEDDKSTKGTHPHAMWACTIGKRKCMSEADTTPICDRRKSADMAMTSQGPRPRPGAPGALVLQACELHYSSAIHSAEAKREACSYPCTRCGLRLSAAKQRHGKINLQNVPDADFNFVDSRHGSMLDSLWGRPVLFHMHSHK